MSKQKTPPEVFARVRSYQDTPHAIVWLLEKDGLTEQCLLFGSLLNAKAEALVALLGEKGFRVEREAANYSVPADVEERGLFDAQ